MSRNSSAVHSMTTPPRTGSECTRQGWAARLLVSPRRAPPGLKNPHHWTAPQVGENRGHLLVGAQPAPSRRLVSAPVGPLLAVRLRCAPSRAGQLPAQFKVVY